MRTARKTGFTPEAPLLPPSLTIIEYKSSNDSNPWKTAHHGPLEVICFNRPANRNRSRALVRFMRWKLTKLNFHEDAVDRLALGLGEAIPNAMKYSIAGSQVGVLLTITGQTPNRVLMLVVSNFIDGTVNLPTKDGVPDLEEILFEMHGRGTGILKILSTGFAVALSENYALTTVVHFTEQLP